MKDFAGKYSQLTHGIAMAWSFLVVAYAGSSDFRDGVNQAALSVYHSLPAPEAKVVSTVFGLGVSLYAFYRQGRAQGKQ